MLEIPGYRWDEATKRYYRDNSLKRPPAPSGSQTVKQDRSKSRQKPESTKSTSYSQSIKSAAKRQAEHGGSASSYKLLDSVAGTQLTYLRARNALKERSLEVTFSKLRPSRVEKPNLALGDSITCFDFENEPEGIVHYGTSQGLIGTGRIHNAPRTLGHSVDDWRMDHMLGATITSMHTSSGYMIATSFGPVAQAVFAKTATTGAVKFSPRKTSLWSSAIHGMNVAIGCDKKVLFSHNPADQAFQSFGTGSAVFALDLRDNELLAGTRSGHLRLFDLRFRLKGGESSTPQVILRLPAPITNVRRLRDSTFVVAQMNGQLSLYDSRFVDRRATELQSYAGHSNTQSQRLGLDIWQDRILSAGGDDGIIRSWTISSGKRVDGAEGNPASQALALQAESLQVLPIKFKSQITGLSPSLWSAQGSTLCEYTCP